MEFLIAFAMWILVSSFFARFTDTKAPIKGYAGYGVCIYDYQLAACPTVARGYHCGCIAAFGAKYFSTMHQVLVTRRLTL